MIMPDNTTAIFWMGHVPNSNQSVVAYAEDCANRITNASVTGVTIGMVMCRNNFTGPSRTPENRTAADIWNHKVSKRYAEKAKGVALTVVGNFTSTSDYLADEFPALIQNTNVTAVLGINAKTCKPSCYWYCSINAAACKVSLKLSFRRYSPLKLTDLIRISSSATSRALGPSTLAQSLVQARLTLDMATNTVVQSSSTVL
jgi:hypothetical protein